MHQRILLQLLNDIDNIEDFVKLSAFDYKMNEEVASEILRLIKQAKDRAIKNM
jgi:hypothetical protein